MHRCKHLQSVIKWRIKPSGAHLNTFVKTGRKQKKKKFISEKKIKLLYVIND